MTRPLNPGFLLRLDFPTAPGIIFVVDSSDRDCIPEARGELHRILNSDKLQRDSPLLVLANKQDLPHAMKEDEIADKLGLHELGERLYCVQVCTLYHFVIFSYDTQTNLLFSVLLRRTWLVCAKVSTRCAHVLIHMSFFNSSMPLIS
jgi:hypothetical protein